MKIIVLVSGWSDNGWLSGGWWILSASVYGITYLNFI